MQPTVFGDVPPSATIAQEEIFGPVLSCLRFDNEAQAIEIANGTTYGLAAAIWTRDTAKGHAIAKKLKALCATDRCAEKRCTNFGRNIDLKFLEVFPMVRAGLASRAFRCSRN